MIRGVHTKHEIILKIGVLIEMTGIKTLNHSINVLKCINHYIGGK